MRFFFWADEFFEVRGRFLRSERVLEIEQRRAMSAVMRQSAVAAAALALVVLVALLAVSQQGPASAAETKAREATKSAAVAKAAASIKGLQVCGCGWLSWVL